MHRPLLPEAFVAAIPSVVGRPLGERVWQILDQLARRYPDIPPAMAGPVDGGYLLGWPLPDRDLQLWITPDGLSWDLTRQGALVTMGYDLTPEPGSPEALYPFSAAMGEVIEEYGQLQRALPPGTDLQ